MTLLRNALYRAGRLVDLAFLGDTDALYVRRNSTPARTAGVAMPPTATPAPDPRT